MSDRVLVRGVTYNYPMVEGSFHLGPINISIPFGEVVFWIGSNGSGKSTLAKIIAGEIKANAGRVEGTDRGVIYYSQSLADNVFPALKVREHFHLLRGHKPKDFSFEEIQRRLPEVFDLAERYPDELSGGQLQMIALATLLLDPKGVYLFDEIFNHLHPDATEKIMQVIIGATHTHNCASVIITHNHELVQRYADRVFLFSGGQLFEEIRGDRSLNIVDLLYDRVATKQ